jgi:hypothetical protein
MEPRKEEERSLTLWSVHMMHNTLVISRNRIVVVLLYTWPFFWVIVRKGISIVIVAA